MLDDRGPGSVSAPLHRTLDECEALLRHAQEAAAACREQAEQDAARVHRDASQQVSQRIDHAAGVADRVLRDAACRAAQIVQDADGRRADVERQLSDLRRSSEERAERTILESERAAAERRRQSENEAVAMLGLAWRQSVTLQQELLDELEAEADDVLRRAEADAASLRHGAERLHAEARRLHDEAAHTRRDARRYADQLFTAALHAAPEPEIHDTDRTRASGRTSHGHVVAARQAELEEDSRGDERSRRTELGAAVEPDPHVDGDRQVVRFALVTLVLALLGGIAVYLADGMVLAPALPAAALLALGAVVLAHR